MNRKLMILLILIIGLTLTFSLTEKTIEETPNFEKQRMVIVPYTIEYIESLPEGEYLELACERLNSNG